MKKLSKISHIFNNFIFYPLSFLIPRKKNLWVFGASNNQFNDNSKYLFLWLHQNDMDIKVVWISGSNNVIKKIRSNGYEAYSRWSLLGLIYCLRAYVYVYSSYVSDINFFTSGGAKLINLWHGVGIKRIESKILKKEPTLINFKSIINNLNFENYKKPDIFLSTSPLMTEHFSDCFKLSKDQIIEGLYPRLEIFKDNELKQLALNLYSNEYDKFLNRIRKYTYSYIYMPTWRYTDSNQIHVALPELNLLNSILNSVNAIFVIKIHPNNYVHENTDLSNILFWNNSLDIYPVLDKFNCLITDYSSILYDFININNKDKNILLYIYDYDEYLRTNGFAYQYTDNTIGIEVKNFKALCSAISENSKMQIFESNLVTKFFGNKNKSLSDLVFEIKKHIKFYV